MDPIIPYLETDRLLLRPPLAASGVEIFLQNFLTGVVAAGLMGIEE